MDEFDYLRGFHDLSLPDWGPYSKKYFGISHLADRAAGMRFDFTVVPAVYRRRLAVPDALRPADYLPWSVSPDLNDYCYRQQLEPKDRVFCDIAFARCDDHLRAMECRCVNHGELRTAFGIHLLSSLVAPPERTLRVKLPDGVRWLDALDNVGFIRAVPRPQDGLVFDALRRGELRESGTVRGGCIGGFGVDAGDALLFHLPPGAPAEFEAVLRCRAVRGVENTVALNGVSRRIIGTGEWELVSFGVVPAGTGLRLISMGKGELKVDGVLVGAGAERARFEPACESVVPSILPGPVPNSRILSFESIECVYGVWWSFNSDFVRHYRSARMNDLLLYNDCVHQPFFGGSCLEETGEDWVDVVMQPLSAAAGESVTVYAAVADGSRDEVEAALRRFAAKREGLPDLFAQSRGRYWKPESTPAGESFRFSRERLAAVTLTNVVFPTYFKGSNVRHHTPGRRWNSLYTWDSGFIGLGLLELGTRPALENLNAYLTEPDDDECAFIHHGSPVPVQFYLYAELINRTGDLRLARHLYPKLRHYYEFMAGRAPSSTMRGASRRNLVRSWDYFYNSGGWDDYPPQWFVHSNRLHDAAPAVGSSHVIRIARIMAAACRELGFEKDLPMYEEDIDSLSELLQRYSWDQGAGYFSYVRHDEADRPCGILRHESGVNFNMGLDGAAPLLAGACTPEQKAGLWEKLADPAHCWTSYGLSTVDQSAPYFRLDGYWNGSIWMPYQWFFWKAALDDGRADFAWRIASTALRVYEDEVSDSRGCYEQFAVATGRGGGWHHFSALSTPVLCWFGAYFVPGRLTGGLDTRIRGQVVSGRVIQADLVIDGPPAERSSLIAVTGPGEWRAGYRGAALPVRRRCAGTIEVDLPRSTSGRLELERID